MSLAVDFVPGCQSVVIVQTESGWAGEVLAPSQAGNLWLQLLSPSPQVDILIRQQCISLGWWGVEEGEHISRWSSNCKRLIAGWTLVSLWGIAVKTQIKPMKIE